ncbi:MAG: DUF427 domain-containing protein [bacterium]
MGLPIHITPAKGRYRIAVGPLVIGETDRAVMLDEAGHSPVLYVPRADMRLDLLTPTPRQSTCPWKGEASYYSAGGQENVIWSYETPIDAVAEIAGHMAFYPAVTVTQI